MLQQTQNLLAKCSPLLLRKAGVKDHVFPAVAWPAFKTKRMSSLLKKSLPHTANLITIDNTDGENMTNLSDVLNQLVESGKQLIRIQKGPEAELPIILAVQTLMDKEDAEVDECVLSAAMNLKEQFADATTLVLDATASAAIISQTMQQKIEPLNLEEVNDDTDKTPEPVANVVSEQKKSTPKTSKPREKRVKAQGASSQVVFDTVHTGTVPHGSQAHGTLSYTPPPGVENFRPSAAAQTRGAARESLKTMFRASLAAPFHPPQQVERELFAGYTNALQLADLISISPCCDGEVYTLYYRITGSGACRTPLITITQKLEKVCRARLGKGSKSGDTPAAKPVPVLVLLSASFLINEDAHLLCEEYQKTLRERLSTLADVTVTVAPMYFTEKDILTALHTSSDGKSEKEGNEDGWRAQMYADTNDASSIMSRRIQANSSITESTIQKVVTKAMEDVVKGQEKSAERINKALERLTTYWSRERVVELMDSLKGEKEILRSVAKEMGDIQQQVRKSQESVTTIQSHVQALSDKLEKIGNSPSAAQGVDNDAFVRSLEDLKTRLTNYLSALPTKQQLSHEMKESMETAKKSLQNVFDQSLQASVKSIQAHQQQSITTVLREQADATSKEREITQNAIQELPKNIQNGMEKALLVLNQRSDEKMVHALGEQQKLMNTKLSDVCNSVNKIIESGHERIERSLQSLLKPGSSSGSPSTSSDGKSTS
uniref:Uncharacterized protein n=1 Tax=Trypanosoma vivax (strain Y486) TaxID=1055687 RepID=G0U4U4_TRYVY|nr:conserved hypothetical protein, fragment [Trypanosoma vivax Y486]